MPAAYVTVTVLAAVAMASAASLSLAGHESVRAAADVVRVPRSWMRALGALLAAGALGLVAGFVVPVLGTAAGAGLALYFLAALAAHLRVRDVNPARLGTVLTFLALALAALGVGIGHHGIW